jgi:hypothetical protein
MKLSLPIVIAWLFTCTALYAQPGYTAGPKEQVDKIQNNILAVILVEAKGAFMYVPAGSTEPTGEAFCRILKTAVENEWKLSHEVKFVNAVEGDRLEKEKIPGYSILKITSITLTHNNSSSNTSSYRDVNVLSLSHADVPNRHVAAVALPDAGLSEGSLTQLILKIQNQVTDFSTKNIRDFGALKMI